MTHAEQILHAVAHLVFREGRDTFTRDDVRRQIGVDRDAWMGGYTAIFQAMRIDHPGGAPSIGDEWVDMFERVGHGVYRLTPLGRTAARRLT